MLTPEILFKTETILLESTYVLSLVSHSFSNFPLSQVFTGEKDQNSCSKGSECCLSCTLLYHWSWNKVGLRSFLKNESKIQLGQVSIISRLSNALWVSNWEDVKEKNLWDYPYVAMFFFKWEAEQLDKSKYDFIQNYFAKMRTRMKYLLQWKKSGYKNVSKCQTKFLYFNISLKSDAMGSHL